MQAPLEFIESRILISVISRHIQLRIQSWWLLALLTCASAVAQEEGGAADGYTLDPIVVSASRIARPLSEVAAQVTVIDADDIERTLAEDLDGLLRYLPGVDAEINGSRFGVVGINIRGIGGNRVEIEYDGIPVRDRFVVGSFSDSGRSLVEPDRIKRAEILHGPASVLYGSNAIGGVVTVTTWDPTDLLARGDGARYFALRGGHRSENDSWVASGLAAFGGGPHGLLLGWTSRSGHELDNQAPEELPDDPQDWDSSDAMLRYTYDTESGNRLRLTASGVERDVDTRIFSQLGYGRRFRNTTSLRGVDHAETTRLSLDYEFARGSWEKGVVRVYTTDSSVEQRTFEERGTQNPPVALQRRFEYDQEHSGVDFSLFRRALWGMTSHRIGVGFEWLRTDSTELRDGLSTNLESGSTTNVILGEVFPLRDFPISRSEELGFFIQDEIAFEGGRWELIPALRWDRYDLDPHVDDIWREDFPDTEVVSVSEDQFTPRLGVLFHGPGEWTFYGQYSRGFRAPPFEDANIGLNIALFGYRAIPNPDLRSETSDGYELGVRRIGRDSSFSLAAFHTDYDDFIETRALIGIDPQTGDLLFQSRNIDRARIRGLDLRYEQALGGWYDKLQGWWLHAAAYWTEGENRQSGQALNSISPPQAVAGLSWTSSDGAWDLGLTAVVTAPKRESDIDAENGERFAAPGWGRVDLTAGWRAREWLEVRAGVFNLGDNTYWRWLDVGRLEPDDPLIPVLSRPGRNVSLSARVRF